MERTFSLSDTPLVSIITPSYNQDKYLERTIRSVLEQDYPNIEYIVIDGGSTDGSVEILEKYDDKIDYWVSKPDKGQTDAINQGFNRAKGEILAWLNSDDTYETCAVSEAVTQLKAHPKVGMVYGENNFIDAEDRVIGRFNAKQASYRRLRQGAVYIPQQATFFRAELWPQVGPLDPSFYFAMDYDLWVRLAQHAPFLYIPDRHWANFRLHGSAKSIAEDDRCWPEMLRVHRRDGGNWFSLIYLRYIARKILAPVVMWRRRALFSGK